MDKVRTKCSSYHAKHQERLNIYRTHTFSGRHVNPRTRQEYRYEASYHGDQRIAWNVKIQTGSCFFLVSNGVIYDNKLSGQSLDNLVKSAVETSIEEIPPPRCHLPVLRVTGYA